MLVENDLQDRGIDLGDRGLLAGRSWRWLRVRIHGLFTENTRIARVLLPREPPTPL